jgi:hypothetical protein
MKLKKKHLLPFLCSILLTSCKHEPQEIIVQTNPTTTNTGATTSTTSSTNDSVCFNKQIQPLFNSSCAKGGCHDAVTRADGYNFTSYSGIMQGIVPGKPSNGKIMKEIMDNSMPQNPNPPLSNTQKALLTKWIEEGAKNRECL